jgi:hypothetical protein
MLSSSFIAGIITAVFMGTELVIEVNLYGCSVKQLVIQPLLNMVQNHFIWLSLKGCQVGT